MNESVLTFKPELVKVTLDGTEYALKYDLNAFCEMEKMYDSVDSVLQMLLGTTTSPDLAKVTYCDAPCLAEDIKIAGVPLKTYIEKIDQPKDVKHSDTLKLLWLGVLHNHTVYNDDGEVLKYTISKAKLGAAITFSNLREVNAKIVTALLRDLLPALAEDDEGKNVEAPEVLVAAQE